MRGRGQGGAGGRNTNEKLNSTAVLNVLNLVLSTYYNSGSRRNKEKDFQQNADSRKLRTGNQCQPTSMA